MHSYAGYAGFFLLLCIEKYNSIKEYKKYRGFIENAPNPAQPCINYPIVNCRLKCQPVELCKIVQIVQTLLLSKNLLQSGDFFAIIQVNMFDSR